MSPPITFTRQPVFEAYSDVIDVRSPSEFADDHVPGARNLYVLNDEERAQIGTIYKQESPFKAKKLGASLVSANIARWTKEYFLEKSKGYRPLIYCWRGGQRSLSLATVLARIGWETTLIEGGYKNYRSEVRNTLENSCPKLNLQIIAGLTGTAKTLILKKLAKKGEQVIDLEELANHRGSLLGLLPGRTQPSQKYFESLLARQIQSFTPQKVVWIESESNKIGKLHCPSALWEQMKLANAIEIKAPITARVDYLLNEYQEFVENSGELKRRLSRLTERHGRDTLKSWYELIDQNQWTVFVNRLLKEHYDPAYQRSIKVNKRKIQRYISLAKLEKEGLEKAVTNLLQIK